MSFFSRLASWFTGGNAAPALGTGPFSTQIEKLSVYAKGREASAMELLAVINHPGIKPILDGLGERFNASTEEYQARPSENEAATIERVASEIAAQYPDKNIHAMPWPGARPLLIVVFITHPDLALQLSQSFGVPEDAIRVIKGNS